MKFSIVFMVLVVLTLSSQTTYSQQVMALTDPYPPFSFEDTKTGLASGYAVEVMRVVMEHTTLEHFKIEIQPWARIYYRATHDANTIIFPIIRTSERERLFKWLFPIFEIKFNFYKLKKRDDIKMNTLEDVKKYQLLVLRGSMTHTKMTEKKGLNIDSKKINLSTSIRQSVQMLYAERGDILVADENVIMAHIRELELNPNAIEAVYPFKEVNKEYYAAFSVTTPDTLLKKVKLGYEKAKASGRLDAIKMQDFITLPKSKNEPLP